MTTFSLFTFAHGFGHTLAFFEREKKNIAWAAARRGEDKVGKIWWSRAWGPSNVMGGGQIPGLSRLGISLRHLRVKQKQGMEGGADFWVKKNTKLPSMIVVCKEWYKMYLIEQLFHHEQNLFYLALSATGHIISVLEWAAREQQWWRSARLPQLRKTVHTTEHKWKNTKPTLWGGWGELLPPLLSFRVTSSPRTMDGKG